MCSFFIRMIRTTIILNWLALMINWWRFFTQSVYHRRLVFTCLVLETIVTVTRYTFSCLLWNSCHILIWFLYRFALFFNIFESHFHFFISFLFFGIILLQKIIDMWLILLRAFAITTSITRFIELSGMIKLWIRIHLLSLFRFIDGIGLSVVFHIHYFFNRRVFIIAHIYFIGKWLDSYLFYVWVDILFIVNFPKFFEKRITLFTNSNQLWWLANNMCMPGGCLTLGLFSPISTVLHILSYYFK